MAKFKVITKQLVQDLEDKIKELQSKRDSYWVEKTEYDKLLEDLIHKALYKTYNTHVTHYHIDGDNFIYHARVPLASMDMIEFPKVPVCPSEHQINKLKIQLLIYSRCEDETISISDQELRTIFGE